ncbi:MULTISPECIES: hypothetical protein [Micrococcus]|uniref:hypothetical protein n=1 Tax=Micrococcus TaxID=1269 RepID=UPI0023F86CC6|nr:hypothetical protein [Micrococcus terreus]
MTITAVRTRRLAGITALGTVTALALSACGSSVPKLEEVWPEVREGIQNASSVKIVGEMDQNGQNVSLDMAGQTDDSSFGGKVTADGISMELVGNKEFTYIKPDAAFWEQQGAAAMQEMAGDKWIESPADIGMNMSSFYEGFRDESPEADEFADTEYTSEEVEHNGQQVYKYTGTDKDSGDPIVVMINKDNQLVRIESQGDSEDSGIGAIDFSEWNAVEPFEMPADEEIFSIPGM